MESPFTLIPVPSVLVCLQVHREIMPLYRRGGSLWIAPSGANPDGLKRKKQDQNRQQDRYSDSHNSTHCLTQQGAGSRQTCASRSEEHTSELQSRGHLVCRLLLEKKKAERRTHARRTKNSVTNLHTKKGPLSKDN